MTARRTIRWTLAAVLAVAGAVAVAWLSRVPYTVHGDDAAMLRLSWRMAVEPVEECRELSPEEQEGVPTHMRRALECDRRVPPHRLEASVDGRSVVRRTVRPGGIRGDRPLYVFEEMLLEPGRHLLRVTFGPEGLEAGDVAPGAERDRSADGERRVLRFEGEVEVGPRGIALVTYDRERGALVLRTPDGPGRAAGSMAVGDRPAAVPVSAPLGSPEAPPREEP